MSLGDRYNNNQNMNQRKEPTVYSYRMNNPDSKIDQTCLTFRMWKTHLIIGIFPRKVTGNDEVAYDMDNGVNIYLSHSKARILKEEIQNFLKDPITYNGVGVASTNAAITISNGAEYGKSCPVLTIRKIDENTGAVLSSFAYEFKQNFYYSIRNYSGKEFDKEFDSYQNIEIEQLITVLEEYYKAATNAVAFTVQAQLNYSQTRIENKVEAIAKNLGVELGGSSSYGRRYGNDSYFNRMGNTNSSSSSSSYGSVSYGSASIDDLE